MLPKKKKPSHRSKSASVSKQDLVKIYRDAVKSGVSVDDLDQKVNRMLARQRSTVTVEKEFDQAREKRWRAQLPVIVKVFALVIPTGLLGLGFYMLGTAVLPIGMHLLVGSRDLTAENLLAPIPREQVIDIVPTVIAQATVTGGDGPAIEPKILDVELDYTNLNNWFNTPLPELADADAQDDGTTYILDIPEVEIENALVKIGGTNLNEGLIHYPGTADPGELGAPVIFGHSVLRQFYNPSEKNKNRYNSIFSYIMTLEPGDDIYITHDGVKYHYRVSEKTEVKPEDVYILAQQRTSKALKLVTCTPEGTYLRRGVVTATLVE